MIGIQLIREAKAGPPIYETTLSNTDPPILSVQSPSNITYSTNIISLNITVVNPSSWDYNKSITEVSYTLDGQKYPLWASFHGKEEANYTFPTINELSAVLTGLANGEHTLKINVQGKYFPNPDNFYPNYGLETSQTIIFTVNVSQSTTPPHFPYAAIIPTFSQSPSLTSSSSPTKQPTIEPSPTLDNVQAENFTTTIIIFGFAIVAVMLGVLVYFKKIKK